MFEGWVAPTAAQWIVMVLLGLGPIGAAFMLWDIGMKHGNVAFLGVLGYASPVISTTLLITLGPGGTDLGAAGVGHADRSGGTIGGAAAAQGVSALRGHIGGGGKAHHAIGNRTGEGSGCRIGRRIQAATVGHRLEALCQSDGGFGSAQNEKAVGATTRAIRSSTSDLVG